MARISIPQYPVDGEAIYVPHGDGAWDIERIEREAKELEKKDAKHPYQDYRSGESRFRLDRVQEYLDEEKDPEKWILNVEGFPPRVRREAEALMHSAARDRLYKRDDIDGKQARAFLLFFKHGVAEVISPPVEISRETRDGSISDKTIAALDLRFDGLVEDIGAAVWHAIRPLDPSEEK